MFNKTFIATLLLAFSVAANPVVVKRSPVSLPISRRLNLTGVHNLVLHDQVRAKTLKARGTAKAAGIPFENAPVVSSSVTNQAVTYIAVVGVGSPPTSFDLLVDTGSSNTWVGATTPFKKTSTTGTTPNKVAVTYGSGSFSGTEFTDLVAITPGLSISGQSIGVASTSTGFQGVDGILGIGPVDLTLGTLSPATNTLIPTVTDNLFTTGTIPAHSIGISFEPTITGDDQNGEITWGGVDTSKFTGAITSIPVTKTSPSSEFWGIDASVQYGTTTILATTAGIVDTGTTLVLIATNAFTKYKTSTGGVVDNATGLLRVTTAQFNALKNLAFVTTGGVSFSLSPNAQIWPRSLNVDIGGIASRIYLIVADLGTPSGEGFDFVAGFAFLERFYSVFDTASNTVGFAATPFTTATSN
ncbi:hypothetical protein GALMADRAFT_143704 [Galerina marginata CBS 339.88]|uniref:Peptidase A1 domain-containing protein n=1 Tax=Galerina marginata (strain CBS 339.88) TaxID=685588 RepID=A0A067SUR2_GALM3|nr:hypothetical protein GALMADRAFT_143704 [Galerina marginata CBS 339.88]